MTEASSDTGPKPTGVPAGIARALATLADDGGHFAMVAVDQRPPIFEALARHGNRRPGDVEYAEVAAVKGVLLEVLSPEASAVLLDPVWAHPHHLAKVPGRVGFLSTLEDHDYALFDDERRSRTIAGWDVAKIKRCGAQGVKLLAWDRPDVSQDTREHQDAFVEAVGRACREFEIPFVLELLVYPRTGEDPSGADYARAKPARVLASVRHYADARFGVDLFKLEFPAELKATEEFAAGAFDGRRRDAVYGLDQVQGFRAELDAASPVPWVLLSAGVGPHEFAFNVELACLAGASGFLAGRAVWYDALEAYPDLDAIRERLRSVSLPYLRSLRAIAQRGRAWTEHRCFGGGIVIEGAGPAWHTGYGT
jgi:tagatose 1,6-diphosphate aldolase